MPGMGYGDVEEKREELQGEKGHKEIFFLSFTEIEKR